MTNKTYKAIFVPVELHHKIKKLALENKVTMIEMLAILIEIKKKGYYTSKKA